jgi:8-oxo-dGTP diphosphatase
LLRFIINYLKYRVAQGGRIMRAQNRVTGLALHDGKVLLIHRFRDGHEFWVFPGDEVGIGEEPDTAIYRVIQDFTGLKLVSHLHLFDEFDEHAFTWFYYACDLVPGEPRFGGPEAQLQTPTNRYLLEWVELEQITELNLYPLPRRLIEFIQTNTGSVGGMAYSESRADTVPVSRMEPINENRVEVVTVTA